MLAAVLIVVFSPCLIITCVAECQRRNESAQTQQEVIDNFPKIPYDSLKFKNEKECSICFLEFEEGEMVTPLPCDLRHTFHSECLE